jgi:PTS system nitrogen regulatory IIA component
MFNDLPSPSPTSPAPPSRGTPAARPRNALAALMQPVDVLFNLDAATKARALEDVARFIGARHGLDAADVHAGLREREKLGSTALGRGVAIPHARVKGLAQPIAAFVRTRLAIPFDAPDGKPVGDLLVLLVPQAATDEHLQLLAQAAAMFCDPPFRERLQRCTDACDVHAAFMQWRPAPGE